MSSRYSCVLRLSCYDTSAGISIPLRLWLLGNGANRASRGGCGQQVPTAFLCN